MKFLVIQTFKGWVGVVKCRGWMQTLAKDDTTIDVVEEMIELIRLIREATVIEKDVASLLPLLGLRGHANGGIQIRRA